MTGVMLCFAETAHHCTEHRGTRLQQVYPNTSSSAHSQVILMHLKARSRLTASKGSVFSRNLVSRLTSSQVSPGFNLKHQALFTKQHTQMFS